MMMSQTFEDKTKNRDMFEPCTSEYQQVVYIDHDARYSTEYWVHVPLKRSRSIAQTEWHNVELVQSFWRDECSLFSVILIHSNLPVSACKVNRWKEFRIFCFIEKVIDSRHGKFILHSVCVQSRVVNTESGIAILLWYKYYWCSKCTCGWSNGSLFLHFEHFLSDEFLFRKWNSVWFCIHWVGICQSNRMFHFSGTANLDLTKQFLKFIQQTVDLSLLVICQIWFLFCVRLGRLLSAIHIIHLRRLFFGSPWVLYRLFHNIGTLNHLAFLFSIGTLNLHWFPLVVELKADIEFGHAVNTQYTVVCHVPGYFEYNSLYCFSNLDVCVQGTENLKRRIVGCCCSWFFFSERIGFH